MRLLGWLFALLVFAGAVNAAPVAPLQNALGRPGIDLGGDWHVIVDPARAGSVSPFEGFPASGFQTPRPWSNDMVLREWNFHGGPKLKVPGDWNSQRADLFFYTGEVWYRRDFTWQPRAGRRALLHFGGVNYLAEVWLNGTKLGSHEGGFTPFAFDATDALTPGDNALVVRVSAAQNARTVPTEATDWLNYGGITREVRLIDVPNAHISDWFVRLTDLKRRAVTADVTVAGAAVGTAVEVTLGRDRARGVLDATGRATLTWRTREPLWTTDAPTLLPLQISSGGDHATDRIGLREVRVAGTKILLNGRPIFLRGISAHEEAIGRPGRAYGPADAAAMLDQVQALGGNFIRLAHYPHNEHVARLADARGILVWEELPIYWGVAFGDAQVLAATKVQAREMVARDRNRASVIMWSIANETPLKPERLAFLSAIAATIRADDTTRPLTAALFGDPFRFSAALAKVISARLALDPATPNDQRVRLTRWLAEREKLSVAQLDQARVAAIAAATPMVTIDDPLGAVVDVVGFNEYLGWYYEGPISRAMPASEAQVRRESLALLPRLRIVTALGKPLVISEFGADAKAGLHGSEDTIFSEEFQARFYRQQIAMIAKTQGLVGVAPWVLKDFRSPRRLLPGIQDYWNRKGLIDENGTRKLAFDVLRRAYAKGGAFNQ